MPVRGPSLHPQQARGFRPAAQAAEAVARPESQDRFHARGVAAHADWLGFILILLATLWLYLPALRTPFFADDYLFLDQVRERSLLEALATPDPLSNFYRPVSRQFFFWCVSRASGESPFVFHAVNLGFLLLVLCLMFLVARRLAGAHAGITATALLALHYTADVPVRWASGSQELLAVAGTLAAFHFHLGGRRVLAAIAMTLAALSKEVVLLAPIIIAVADHRPNERWVATARRAWPLGLAVALWGAVWLLMPQRYSQVETEVELHPWGPVATLIHLVQVVLGFETRKGELGRLPTVWPPLVPLALACGAVALSAWWGARARATRPHDERPPALGAVENPRTSRGAQARNKPRGVDAPPSRKRKWSYAVWHPVRVGMLWALLGSVPVIAVAILWSAYYYLFAMCGVALALGAWLARRPIGWTFMALVVLAWGSESARQLQEFATPRSPWTEQSHINRFYIERATRYVERYLEDLKRMHPSLPQGATLFFAGLKGNIAFQVADGPLVRWAYRDSSLRSYYLNSFTLEKASRGPTLFFIGRQDSLGEIHHDQDLYTGIAFSMIVNDWPAGARDALTLALRRNPAGQRENYWMAWVQAALGDMHGARVSLRRAQITPDPGPSTGVPLAMAALVSGDTVAATRIMREEVARHGLDPAPHALLADLYLVANPDDPSGPIEAYATRILAPREPLAWRRWGAVQLHRERYLEALASFDRYFALAGESGRRDAEAQRWVANVRSILPGGDVAPEGQRER
jgi:hypothetical protein